MIAKVCIFQNIYTYVVVVVCVRRGEWRKLRGAVVFDRGRLKAQHRRLQTSWDFCQGPTLSTSRQMHPTLKRQTYIQIQVNPGVTLALFIE